MFVLGLKKKYVKQDEQISGVQRTNKWGAAYYFSYNFLKFTDQFFLSSNGCTSCVSQIWLQVTKTTLIFCTRWLAWKKM